MLACGVGSRSDGLRRFLLLGEAGKWITRFAIDRFNLRVNTMGIVLREVRSGRACKILAMGTDKDCPLFDFLAKLGRDDQKEFAKLRALLDRTAEHGTIRNDQKFRFFNAEKVFEFKTPGGVRVMGFWDEGRIIICSHGFLKKSQKTPERELARAVAARAKYFADKLCERLKELQ